MDRVLGIYFLPPLAIARVGGSDKPVENFTWDSDRTIHGAHRTVIRPSVSFKVLGNGSLEAYLPRDIRFRDRKGLRPVAPFFELWAWVQTAPGGEPAEVPVTLDLLKRLGGSTNNVQYIITVANRKAERRTDSASCSFIARAKATASDFEPRPLFAYSPHTADEEPLVYADRPIPLGHFRVIKPKRQKSLGADLSILRVRFYPARGLVYGPPDAIAGPASPLQPGQDLPPVTLGGRLHEIVLPENRILNPNTPWSRYAMRQADQHNPAPSDSYDGANVGDNRSWGVVDDSCDGIIEAHLVLGGQRFSATARILSSCPDYAPDRRPFFALADELADRDLPAHTAKSGTMDDRMVEIADLFERVIETASMINLDSTRQKFLGENADFGQENPRGLPKTDERSMTKADVPYVDLAPALLIEGGKVSVPQDQVPRVDAIGVAHRKLADFDTLIDFLRSRPDHIRKLVRPPFGRFWQLKRQPGKRPDPRFRDPRVDRDTTHDMRMPPYMRDSDMAPLSLTWLQYETLMTLLVDLAKKPKASVGDVADRSSKIVPRNLTALATRVVPGNPVVTRPEDAVANYFPGLELDGRNLDRRFFPGLVFDFVVFEGEEYEGDPFGARLAYIDPLEDPDLQADTRRARELLETLSEGGEAADILSHGVWYLAWLEQEGKHVSLHGLNGHAVWRLVRSLEPKELRIGLRRRDTKGDPKERRRHHLDGWRRRYTDRRTGVINGVYRPGELMQGLCSPWQHDFRDCACFYWASNHPDLVYSRVIPGEDRFPDGTLRDPVRANTRLDWLRAERASALSAGAKGSIAANRPFQYDHHEINRTWQDLNIVLGNAEIGERYRPPKADKARPFRSRRELLGQLRQKAAPLEMALAIEYLYAMFSVVSSQEAKALASRERRWATLPDDVAFVRHRLKLIAISEMEHLRWANQLLWELHQQQPDAPFKPVLRQAGTIPTGKRRRSRRHSLRPLLPHVLEQYIAVERPSGNIDGEYVRIVATLRRTDRGYPAHMAELAERIVNDGLHHESEFLQIKSVLRPYIKAGPPYPYLRKLKPGLPGSRKVGPALRLFRTIIDNLEIAYARSAGRKYAQSSPYVGRARAAMDKLLVIGEELAAEGIGIPFPAHK